jgi:hypothetical protein
MGFATTIARQVIGWALIALFGPAPFTSLFAASAGAECHMACCKRNRTQHSCDRHSGSTESAEIGGSDECRLDCSRAAAGLGSILAVILPPSMSRGVSDTHHGHVAAPSNRAVVAFNDPFLYQRPPPILSF